MYYDMDYYGVLMSKIGGGSGWNNYGYGSTMKTGGRQTLTKGQAVKQASYADTFMRMSKAERRESIESNISTGNSGLYGLLGNYYGLAGGYGSSIGLSSYLNNWFA